MECCHSSQLSDQGNCQQPNMARRVEFVGTMQILGSPCWYAGSVVPADTRFCPMCGASVTEAIGECAACGETLSPDDAPTPAVPADAPEFAKAKRRRLAWLLVLAAAAGIATQVVADAGREIQVLEAIGIALLIASWCTIDARQRGGTIGRLQFLGIVFFTIIGLPVYLLRTRGMHGIASILLALLFYLAMIGVQLTATVIAHLLV